VLHTLHDLAAGTGGVGGAAGAGAPDARAGQYVWRTTPRLWARELPDGRCAPRLRHDVLALAIEGRLWLACVRGRSTNAHVYARHDAKTMRWRACLQHPTRCSTTGKKLPVWQRFLGRLHNLSLSEKAQEQPKTGLYEHSTCTAGDGVLGALWPAAAARRVPAARPCPWSSFVAFPQGQKEGKHSGNHCNASIPFLF